MKFRTLLRNPISNWVLWLIRYYKLLKKNKNKNLKLGYLSLISNTKIGKYITLYDYVYVSNSTLGNFIYISENSKISNCKIGNYCSIGQNVKIGAGKHPIDFITTFPAFFSIRKQCQVTFVSKNLFTEVEEVVLGNDVWIGNNVLVLDGVNIGNGAIIAAGAVVTKDVEAYSVVGGVPAKLIKKRFEDDYISYLEEIKWWDKSEEWVKKMPYSLVNHQSFFKC